MKHSRQGKFLNFFSRFCFKNLVNRMDSYEDVSDDYSYDEEMYYDTDIEDDKISSLQYLLPEMPSERLEKLMQQTEDAEKLKFSHDLFHLLNEKQMSNPECFKNACMSQQVFSKIINSKPGHCPEKKTVIHLALAMRLSLEETERFLNKTGYALTNRYILDLVAVFLIQNKIYDVQLLDECVRILSSPK